MAGQSSNQKTISILKPPAEKHGQEVRLCTQKNSYGWTYGKEKVQKKKKKLTSVSFMYVCEGRKWSYVSF